MITNEDNQHPWLLEDVGLRALAASRRFYAAVKLLEGVEPMDGKKEDLIYQIRDIRRLAEASERFGRNMKAGAV